VDEPDGHPYRRQSSPRVGADGVAGGQAELVVLSLVFATRSVATWRMGRLRCWETVRRMLKASSELQRSVAMTMPMAWSITDRLDRALRRWSVRVASL